MRVAYHFDPAFFSGVYSLTITELLFRELLQVPAHLRHFLIRRGDLLTDRVSESEPEISTLVGRLLGLGYPIWRTVSAEWLIQNLRAVPLYVLVVEGLRGRDASRIDGALRPIEGYIGGNPDPRGDWNSLGLIPDWPPSAIPSGR